jgi:hypothetical protein
MIRDVYPYPVFFLPGPQIRIPDPAVKKALDSGSATLILKIENT